MEDPNISTKPKSSPEDNSEDLKKIIFQYIKYWPWFIVSIFITTSVAYLYLRYSDDIYETHTEVKVLKEHSGLDLKGLQGSAPLIDMRTVNLDNEMSVLKSRRIAEKIVEKLNLTAVYYRAGSIKSIEIWKEERPFVVHWSEKDSVKATALYTINFKSLEQFEITNSNTDETRTFDVGEPITVDRNSFTIDLNPDYQGSFSDLTKVSYSFRFSSKFQAITSLTSQIQMEPIGKSDVLNISINGPNRFKNEDILDTLVNQYNTDGVEDNRLIAKRTEEFVIERLKFLVRELDTVEGGIVDYKSKYNIFEINNSASQLLSKNSNTEQEIFEISSQLALTKSFKEELLNQEQYKLLPARIGITSDNINKFTDAYNEEILERERLLVSSTNENPKVKEINNLLNQLKNNILNTIDSYIKSLNIKLDELKQREKRFDFDISELPEQEKEIRSIERQQEVKQKLYLFLLQKREEAALSYAITAPVIKIVDFAYTKPAPVNPRSNIVYLSSTFIGLVLPFGLLYLFFLFDTKIKTKEQIRDFLPDMPIVAELPFQKKSNLVVLPNDNSSIAEAFRIMRTNLSFLISNKKNKTSPNSQVVFVTSTTKGEGKTFVAVNLASTLVAAKKKVVLIGCDLRNPQIHNYLNIGKDHIGVTNFLHDDSIDLQSIILKKSIKDLDLDFILSGTIPPNPAELLLSSRFTQLIEEAKEKYDYVLVDTAPTILVTDTILISKNADVTLYITRSGVTDTRLIPHIREIKEEGKLVNMGIVINGLKGSGLNACNYGYGYGYGYGYSYGYGGERRKNKIWQFWK